MGDISRFDNVKEIQKLSGLGLVACSSGKHIGETKISYRGRKRLRYWLFQAAKSAVAHSEEFKELHVYYTTRKQNPLKKMQSLIVIACKILRVIFTILTKGTTYDPKKLLGDIVRPEQAHHRQHKYYLRFHYNSRPLPGFRVYLDLGRVLEKKPINWIECEVHYISTKTN